MYRNGTMMYCQLKREWSANLIHTLNGITKLHVDVKDWTWSGSALIAGWLVLTRTLVSRRRQRKVEDEGAVFATTML